MRQVKKIISILLLISFFTVSASAELSSDEISQIQKERDAVAGRKASVQSRIDSLAEERQSAIAYKMALEEKNEAAKEEIRLIKKEIALYNRMVNEKGKEVEEAKRNEAEHLEKFRSRVRAMEENGELSFLSLLFNANSFAELLSAFDDYGEIMQSDKLLYDQLQTARKKLQDVQAEYEKYKYECEAKQMALEEEQAALEEEIAYADKYIADLEIAIEQAEDEKAAMAVMLSRAYDSAGNYVNSYIESGGQSSVVGTGNFSWPFANSTRVSSTMKNRWGRDHNGIDIDGFALEGSSISAADSGTVITSGYDPNGYGNYVIIDHGNGYQTLYAHMDDVSVSAGDTVNNGESIGTVGSTGSATGTHLHFEVMENGQRVDPLTQYSDYEVEPGADTPS